MTKKCFNAIAIIIKSELDFCKRRNESTKSIERVYQAVAYDFVLKYKNFDRNKFKKVCGF